MNTPSHPLEIFEIVATIGRYTQLWRPRSLDPLDIWGYDEELEFFPEEFLPYTLVSKTWRAALLPIFWEFYDGEAMSSIPNEIISKYSHYFVNVVNCAHQGPFDCKNLRLLETTELNSHCYKMVRDSQPSISILKWVACDRYQRLTLDLSESIKDGGTEPETMKLSMFATTLTDLELRDWEVDSTQQLLQFLTRYKRLSRITLKYVCGLNETPYSASLKKDDPLPQPYLILPTVTTLHLDGSLQRSEALLDVAICCPNLNRLEIVGSWMSDMSSYTDLPIYRYCPNLSSVSITIPEIDCGAGRFMADSEDLLSLVKKLLGPSGSGRLKTFEMDLTEFGATLSRSLVKIAKDTLEHFSLKLCDDYGAEDGWVENVTHILMNCHKLKTVSIEYRGTHAIECIEGPWACLDTLEELVIYEVYHSEVASRLEEEEVADEYGNVWRHHGDKTYLSLELMESIFRQVKHMPRLRKLVINQVPFSAPNRINRIEPKFDYTKIYPFFSYDSIGSNDLKFE